MAPQTMADALRRDLDALSLATEAWQIERVLARLPCSKAIKPGHLWREAEALGIAQSVEALIHRGLLEQAHFLSQKGLGSERCGAQMRTKAIERGAYGALKKEDFEALRFWLKEDRLAGFWAARQCLAWRDAKRFKALSQEWDFCVGASELLASAASQGLASAARLLLPKADLGAALAQLPLNGEAAERLKAWAVKEELLALKKATPRAPSASSAKKPSL